MGLDYRVTVRLPKELIESLGKSIVDLNKRNKTSKVTVSNFTRDALKEQIKTQGVEVHEAFKDTI